MAHRLSQHEWLSLSLAEASETLLLKAGGEGPVCTKAGMEEGLGMMWWGSFSGSLSLHVLFQ